ncbi:MAG: sigma-70 family RNA polymerase sigma factor [Phycisphaerae bacterium]
MCIPCEHDGPFEPVDASEDVDAVTQALTDCLSNGHATSDELLPVLYQTLRAVALRRIASEASGHTLDATALVHEAYLRLIQGQDQWQNKRHFLGSAAKAMRDILVDHARRKKAAKRGSGVRPKQLDEVWDVVAPHDDHIFDVAEAVELLEREDPRKAEIVNLRYFVGLTVSETADLLGVSVGTVEREWRYLRTWLTARFLDNPSGSAG